MATTKHMNLQEMATGAVEWPAIINDLINKVEAGRTIKAIAGEAFAVRDPFYIKTADGKAWKATSSTERNGIWQSTSTGVGVEGFGQIDGVMTYGSWTWTKGIFLYVSAGGALTETPPNPSSRPIAFTISATEIMILPSDIGDPNKAYASVQTTDATITTLIAKTLAEGKAYILNANVVGKQADTNRASYVRRACVYRPAAGSATLQGTVQDDMTASIIINDEAVGTGDGSTTTFDLDHKDVIENSLKGYSAGNQKNASISKGTGAGGVDQIVFSVAPANGETIKADYNYSNVSWNCTIDVSGNDARVRITGVVATTIDWKGNLEFIEI